MKLVQNIEIKEDNITASISVAELGDTVRDAETELNQLHNFVREIEFSQIDFKSAMKLVNGVPQITTDPVDDSNIEEIEISDLINKKYIINENLSVSHTFDITRIPAADCAAKHVFNSPELLGQAYAVLFIEKIKATVAGKLAEIRALANDIEKETEVIL